MTPMIDTMVVPGLATAMISVGPAFVGVGLALVAGVVWIARGTREELRRVAGREPEPRILHVETSHPGALAA